MWLPPEDLAQGRTSRGEEFVAATGGPGPDGECVAATGPADDPQSMRDAAHIARWGPVRVLSDAAAKRAVLGALQAAEEWGQDRRDLVYVVRHLAAVYRDHPDYQEEWAP